MTLLYVWVREENKFVVWLKLLGFSSFFTLMLKAVCSNILSTLV